ncbi:hypothetical protein ACF0H5_017662 [Mactra antiquata]
MRNNEGTNCLGFYLSCKDPMSAVFKDKCVIWREDCSYKPVVPYWVMISSVTPFIVIFVSSKGANDQYLGVTFWRILSLVTYCLFTTWVILGSVWIYDTWIHSSDDECDKVIKLFSFVLVCVHWLIVVIVTIPQVYILTQICCCCTENAIKPLKRHRPTNWDDDVF